MQYSRSMKRYGNWPAISGVYMSMSKGLLSLLCAGLALAQTPPADPIYAKREAIGKARREGRFADAAALREEARAILLKVPADAPQFSGWATAVMQMYQDSGRTVQARAVVEDALGRAGQGSAANPNRAVLLQSMAQLWQQDGNLLKAAAYLEQAAVAAEAAADAPAAPAAGMALNRQVTFSGLVAFSGRAMRFGGPGADAGGIYQQLADLNRQLGRRDAVEAVVGKMRTLAAKRGDARYTWFFERYGSGDEAAAMLREQADRATNPQQAMNALQELAQLYARTQRYDQAIAAMQQAVAAASGANDLWVKQNLISILRQAGRLDQADKAYQELLAATGEGEDGNRFQVTVGYANYLSETKRAAGAEALLKEYRASHANLQPGQESGLLYSMANAARTLGDSKRAEEYQQQATAKQPVSPADESAEARIGPDLTKATSAVWAGRLDEALRLALEALDRASRAVDREQVGWQVPQIANALAGKKAAAAAYQLYDRLFSVLDGWAVDIQQPLLNATADYARSLFSQRERWAEVPAALERHRSLETAAHGADTSHAKIALQMTVDFERGRNQPAAALRAAQDMLTMEESLSGKTSEAYLNTLRTVAECNEQNGDRDAALLVYLQRIVIADAAFTAKDEILGHTRNDAAQVLSRQGKFDEAEGLLNQANELAKNWAPHSSNFFTQQLTQIRLMRARQPRPAPSAPKQL